MDFLRWFKNTKKIKPIFVIITGCAGSGKSYLGRRLAKNTGWVYIDKDTLTEDFTELILEENKKSKFDRESEYYCKNIRPLEYKTIFKMCEENLKLGNSVILTLPFTAQITDHNKWVELQKDVEIDLTEVDVKFVWINHNESQEYARLTNRNAGRDKYKLEHWQAYTDIMKDITPDEEHLVYCYDNNGTLSDDAHFKDLLQWLKQQE